MTDKRREELRKEWLAALRSGDYERGEGMLRWTNPYNNKKKTYCCLGVVCDIYEPKLWIERAKKSTGKGDYFDGETGELPCEVSEALGVHPSGSFNTIITAPNGKRYNNLATMNDSGNFSFAAIANIIEEKFASNDFVKAGEEV